MQNFPPDTLDVELPTDPWDIPPPPPPSSSNIVFKEFKTVSKPQAHLPKIQICQSSEYTFFYTSPL